MRVGFKYTLRYFKTINERFKKKNKTKVLTLGGDRILENIPSEYDFNEYYAYAENKLKKVKENLFAASQ